MRFGSRAGIRECAVRFLGRRWAKHVAALLFFILVYGFLTYPVMTRPGYWVWGRPFEDAFESIWYIEWYKQAFFDLNVSPLHQPDIYYPHGWDLRFAILPPLYPTMLAPLTLALGSVAAYNYALLFSCVFAAYGTFLLAEQVSGSWWGACLAGVLFSCSPQREI